MDRDALAAELFEVFQSMRSEVGSLKLEAGLAAPDLAGRVAVGASKLARLIERGHAITAGYVASADSGATRVTAQG